jgi:hypothetical protein
MPDPGGKGIYFVNGKSSGFLTAYNVHSKQSTDISSENATQPVISRDGKRVMYITTPTRDRSELWVANVDGTNKVKITTAKSLGTGYWAPDDLHLLFMEELPGASDKAYSVAADGSGLRQLPWTSGGIQALLWSIDQKTVYFNSYDEGASKSTVWREDADGSNLKVLAEGCGHAFDTAPGGQYLLTINFAAGGIDQISASDGKCTHLLPGVSSFGISFAPDGKSFLYAVPSRSEVTIFRQGWHDGKLVGPTQVALKLPFAFPLLAGGNAYDFSRDLSTIVYARPGGQADLYLLSQK